MLIAELHKKLRPFACAHCGELAAPETTVGVEDALTSHVFGTLRHLPSQFGIRPILEHVGIVLAGDGDHVINLWPSGSVQVVEPGTADVTTRDLEPDVEVVGPGLLVCVEAKLGSKLGADPLQLPKQVLWTAAKAKGDWFLLCPTADAVEPRISSYGTSDGRVVLGNLLPLAAAVATYFSAARAVAPQLRWPAPDLVRTRIKWISWSAIASVLTTAAHDAVVPPWASRALEDVAALLRAKGLVVDSFAGFRLETRDVPVALGPIWRGSANRQLWASLDSADVPNHWPGWLTQPGRSVPLWSIPAWEGVDSASHFPICWSFPEGARR